MRLKVKSKHSIALQLNKKAADCHMRIWLIYVKY